MGSLSRSNENVCQTGISLFSFGKKLESLLHEYWLRLKNFTIHKIRTTFKFNPRKQSVFGTSRVAFELIDTYGI